MEELTKQSVTKLASLIRTRAVSPVEVIEAYLRRIERLNPHLNAIVTLAPDAVDRSRELEALVIRGEVIGPLHGVPLTVKDTINTAGLRTTSGSLLRTENIPAKDAPAVVRLREAGAIVLGKTNVSEMALTYESDNPVFGRTNNPHDPRLTPGGSSGGEAAAISACLSPAGLGSDLVGSIRIPAHFCGISGLKPTTGHSRILTEGHCPQMSDPPLQWAGSTGPMARHVEDLGLLFDALAGIKKSSELTRTAGEDDLRGQRAAWYTDDLCAPVTEETRRAVEAAARALAAAGLEIIEERPPGIEQGAVLWLQLFGEAAARTACMAYSGKEASAGPDVRALLSRKARVAGEEAPGALLARLSDLLERWRGPLLSWMRTTPLLVAPVGAGPAFEHGARKVRVGEQSIGVFQAFSYSQTFNTYGLPSACVPAGRSREGSPIGVQIVGRPHSERMVLAAALIIEEALGGWQPPPFALS